MTNPRRGSTQAEALRQKLGLSHDHLVGIRFAINVGIGTTIVWLVLGRGWHVSPIWAIASMVAASDPQPLEAKKMFKARLANVAVGCVVGLAFVVVAQGKEWMLPIALATTVLISSFVVRIKTMWRQAPITAAIVIAAGILQGSAVAGIERGLQKVVQVVFGCLVGLIVSLAMSRVWFVDIPVKDTKAPAPPPEKK
ncbi:MAG TPA: FUSC family protein [Candidatus Didemnitutus sp.]|nr:FUSC family protein [Candidatus Didemnitutus sp.]